MAENLLERTIEVSGFPPHTSDAELESHFQDKKKCGGEIAGPIKRLDSKARITFKDKQVADSVASVKHNFGPSRVLLTVTCMASSKPGAAQAVGGNGMQRPSASLNSSPSVSNDLNSMNNAYGGDVRTSGLSNLSDNRVRLKVTNIPPGTSKKHIELYFKKQAGGSAPEVECDVESTWAYLYFASQEAVDKVLSTPNLINKQPVDVCLDAIRPSDSTSADSAGARTTLIVSGIPPSVSKKHLELYFKKQAGGNQPEVEYDIERGTAQVHFSNREVAENVVKQDNALNKVTVRVSFAESKPVTISSKAVSDVVNLGTDAWIIVEGIPPNTVKKHIELYFKKLAGGVQPEVEYYADRQTAHLRFPSQKDANLVLAQPDLAINKVPLQVALLASPSGGAGRPPLAVTSVEVMGVEPHQEELVRFYFMKYGFIDCFRYLSSDKKLLLKFSEQDDANTVLQKLTHDIDGSQVKVTVSPAQTDTLLGDDLSAPMKCATSILVTGIPPGICGKHLQLYFESTALSGGGEIANLDFTPGSSSARITFTCSSVAQRISTVGRHYVIGMPLSVTLLQDSVDPAMEHLLDMDDSDFGPGSILVNGIPETLVKDHLRIYFSDYDLSGGGKIRKLHYNKLGGCAIVVFQDSEVARRVVAAGSHRLIGRSLQVELLQSNQENKEEVLLVTGYPKTEKWRESLWWWLSSAADSRPRELHFKDDNSAAIAFFDVPVAPKAIRFSCYNFLDGHQLTVKRMLPTNTLLITSLPPALTRTTLKYYLEHADQGGTAGCVATMEVTGTTAKIVLNSATVVRSIIKHCGTYEDHQLMLSPYYQEIGQVSDKQKFSLEDGFYATAHSNLPPLLVLTGFSRHSDTSAVYQFFEDLKDADKGNAANMCFEEGELRAQLTDMAVAESIFKEASDQKLKFSGVLIAAKFREQRFSAGKERAAVIVRNADHVLPDHLKYFLWSLSHVPVVSMRQINDSLGRSCWLVRFVRELEFNGLGMLPWLPANFQGSPFDVELASKPCSILVSNMPADVNEEYLKILFHRNGACMNRATWAPSGGAIIEFASNKDVNRVLRQHIFYNDTTLLLMEARY